MADDIRHLHVHVAVHIDDDTVAVHNAGIPIPPDYDDTDTAALAVRQVEDAAFALIRAQWGRQPTREALLAAAARLWRLEQVVGSLPAGEGRAAVEQLLAVSNAQARALWGDEGEGG